MAVHHLRENTHTRYTACVNRYLIPGHGKKKLTKLTKLTAKDVRTWLNQLRTTCQCCAYGIDTPRVEPRCCAVKQCCRKLLSPLTLTYIHSVLKSALEHAVQEEEITRNERTGAPQPRRFEPLTADETASSSRPRADTGCTLCSNSLSTPDSARANSSACVGKTSTLMRAPL